MRDWKQLCKKIGPLRYQSSDSDCVPTTVINGLNVLLQRQIHPKLLHLIWSISLDREEKIGTGFVCCDLLPDLLQKWFELAPEDGYEPNLNESVSYGSRILKGSAVHIGQRNPIVHCLNGGGVGILLVADHYYLIVGFEAEKFLLFDCLWNKDEHMPELQVQKDLAQQYWGIVNAVWTREKMETELSKDKWVHLLERQIQ